MTRDLNALQVDPTTGKYVCDPSTGLFVSDRIPGTRRDNVAEQTSLQYIGKLTWSPSADDRVELSHRGTPSRSGGSGRWAVDYETGRPQLYQYGTYDAMAYMTRFDSYGSNLRWTHSALNKRLSFDSALGWQYEHSADLAADGGNVGDPGLASTPRFRYLRTSPVHSITDFERIGVPALCKAAGAMGGLPCPVARYYVGGPGLIQDRTSVRRARPLSGPVHATLGHQEYVLMGYQQL